METSDIRFKFQYSKEAVQKMTAEDREKYEYYFSRYDKDILPADVQDELGKRLEEIFTEQLNESQADGWDDEEAYGLARLASQAFEKGYIHGYLASKCRDVLRLTSIGFTYNQIKEMTIFNSDEIDYICSMREL